MTFIATVSHSIYYPRINKQHTPYNQKPKPKTTQFRSRSLDRIPLEASPFQVTNYNTTHSPCPSFNLFLFLFMAEPVEIDPPVRAPRKRALVIPLTYEQKEKDFEDWLEAGIDDGNEVIKILKRN